MQGKWHHSPGDINGGKQHSEQQEGHCSGGYFCLPEIWIRAPLLFWLVSAPWPVRWAISGERGPEGAATSAVLKLWLALNTQTQSPASSHAEEPFQLMCCSKWWENTLITNQRLIWNLKHSWCFVNKEECVNKSTCV